ncbi:hypothetical protein ML8HA_02761 [Lactococcus lactis]|nr:hypothetical protein [Lactococcus lactis]
MQDSWSGRRRQRRFNRNIQPKQGYFIQPDQLFYHYRIKADNYEFNLTDLQAGFNELERQGEEFSGLFADIDLKLHKIRLKCTTT